MTKKEIITKLKAGRTLICDRWDEPLLPWLLNHPDITNGGIEKIDSQSSAIRFWWRNSHD